MIVFREAPQVVSTGWDFGNWWGKGSLMVYDVLSLSPSLCSPGLYLLLLLLLTLPKPQPFEFSVTVELTSLPP